MLGTVESGCLLPLQSVFLNEEALHTTPEGSGSAPECANSVMKETENLNENERDGNLHRKVVPCVLVQKDAYAAAGCLSGK